MNEERLELGPYRGFVAPEYREGSFLSQLGELPAHLAPHETVHGPFQRSRVVPANLSCNGVAVKVAVKVFLPQGAVRSMLARAYGSKARQSWDVASALWERGVGTPRPIGFLERWERGRLKESYFLTEFVDEMSTLHEELLHLYYEEPFYDRFLELMDSVALAVRAMHDAGVLHGDLGNQNIFLRRKGTNEWGDVQFIDVNRGRARAALGMRERAFDLSRLTLPSRFRKLFLRMYWRDRYLAGERPPRVFARFHRFYRLGFRLHTWTRPLRHPIRSFKKRRLDPNKKTYPAPRELWIWDERSDQPIGALRKSERFLHHSVTSGLRVAWKTATTFLPALLGGRRLRPECYSAEVALKGRIGMTISPTPATADAELRFLKELGKLPLLVRFYAHESEREWNFLADHLRRLHDDGHSVSIALVQDRRAIREPAHWKAFVAHVLDRVGDIVEWVEVGHATNRIKWGVWSLAEYASLLAPFRDLGGRYKLLGPAINDFEYHFVAAMLDSLPRGVRLDAMSLHLYVDRRGAPESTQAGFSALDKFVLARALARLSRRCEERVVVSEVNWFLKDETGYAHRFAPYANPAVADWDITEDRYADYMVRYYLHAICSGMVERVYWWRLVSRAFGLVDDTEPESWRARPAFTALRNFLRYFGEATFVGVLASPEGTHLFRFRQPDGSEAVIGFSTDGERTVEVPFAFERAEDALGETKKGDVLSGRPLYYFRIS